MSDHEISEWIAVFLNRFQHDLGKVYWWRPRQQISRFVFTDQKKKEVFLIRSEDDSVEELREFIFEWLKNKENSILTQEIYEFNGRKESLTWSRETIEFAFNTIFKEDFVLLLFF